MKAIYLALGILLTAEMAAAQATPDSAKPFGIPFGTSKSRLASAIKKEVAPSIYQVSVVPRPHRGFESYYVQVTPRTGVCFVKGIGVTIDTSSFGTQLKTAFEDIRDQVSTVYGEPEMIDVLSTGSIWDEPRDWMMGLRQNDRRLLAHWSGEDLTTSHPGLKEIYLAAKAIDSDRGFLVIEYYSENYDRCDADAKKAESKAF